MIDRNTGLRNNKYTTTIETKINNIKLVSEIRAPKSTRELVIARRVISENVS